MQRLTRLLTLALFMTLAGDALADPPPVKSVPEPLWFEAPAATAPAAKKPAVRRAARAPGARRSRYGGQVSLGTRSRTQPSLDCKTSCVERQLARKQAPRRRDRRVVDLTSAAQLYR